MTMRRTFAIASALTALAASACSTSDDAETSSAATSVSPTPSTESTSTVAGPDATTASTTASSATATPDPSTAQAEQMIVRFTSNETSVDVVIGAEALDEHLATLAAPGVDGLVFLNGQGGYVRRTRIYSCWQSA